MKFKAAESIGDKITEGEIYDGSIIVEYEAGRNGGSDKNTIKIVVYNNNGRWASYHPSRFEPFDSNED